MNKKMVALMLSILMAFTIVMTGCAKKEEPKEAMKKAAEAAVSMTSYEMKSSVIIEDLQVKMADAASDPSVGMVVNMLKNAELTVTGVHQAEPMQTEMQMGVNLKGDMAMTFNIDIVMTPEKMYVKIPSIPMFPMPQEIVGKYLEMDLKELAEQSGETYNPAMFDTKKSQKFVNEIMNAVLADFDQAKFFKEVETKDAKLPEGVDAKQVVQFFVTNDTLKEAMDTIVKKSAPKVVDIAAKDEYKELLGLTQADIDEAKEAVKTVDEGQFNKDMEDLQKHLKINTFNINTAIDKKDFPAYQDIVLNVDFNDPESTDNVKLGIKATTQYSKINEKQTFKAIPTGDDVITMEKLEEVMSQMGAF